MRKLCPKMLVCFLVVSSCFNLIKKSYTVFDNGWNLNPSIRSVIGSYLNGQQRVKPVQSDQIGKCHLVRFLSPYITLRRKKPSIANIMWPFWCVWWNKLRRNVPKWRKSALSLGATMRLQQWQNCTNCTLNCFPIYRIFRIWLPATTTCKQVVDAESWKQEMCF